MIGVFAPNLLFNSLLPIVGKMVETRLRWFEHVENRFIDSIVRIVDLKTRADKDLEKL